MRARRTAGKAAPRDRKTCKRGALDQGFEAVVSAGRFFT